MNVWLCMWHIVTVCMWNELRPYLCTFWKLLCCTVQKHMSLIRQVHVDTVGSEVIRHCQFVIAMVTHLLHDLHTQVRDRQKMDIEANKRQSVSAHITFRETERKQLYRLSDTLNQEARSQYQRQHHIILHAKPLSWSGGVEGLMENTGAGRHSFSADVMLFM